MGKTALALQILLNLSVVQRLRTMFFSLEMPRKVVMQRAASNIARIPFDRIRDPKPVFDGKNQIRGLHDEDWPKITAAMTTIKGAPMIISDGAKQSAAKIVAQAQRAHQKGPLSAIVVDHSLLMSFPGAKDEGARRLALSDAMKEFVALSKPEQLNCPIILLHQLNRDNEKRSDKRPIMSDLAASGAAEQDADYILAPHRDSYYESGGASASGLAEIILMKGRNTPTGSVPVNWEGQYQNFGEWRGQWPIVKQQEKNQYQRTFSRKN
jgi:replicative DNA helicase